MAICRGCGKDIRDDIWVCGYCGELVSRSATSPANEAADVQTVAPTSASPGASGDPQPTFVAAGPSGDPAPTPLPTSAASSSSHGSSHASKSDSGSRVIMFVSVFGIVAVLAIVAVWFFLLRGGGDFSAYLGEWEFAAQSSTVGLSLTIKDGGGEPQLLLGTTGTYGEQTSVQSSGPFKMELDGSSLVTKLEAADDASEEQKMAAEAARAALGAVVDDFRMVFTAGSGGDTLSLTMDGEIEGCTIFAGDVGSQELTLTRTGSSASQSL